MPASVPTLSFEKLRVLVEAGAVQHVDVVGTAGGWHVWAQVGMQRRVLNSTRVSEPRLFKSADTVLSLMREAGVRRVHFDQAGFTSDAS